MAAIDRVSTAMDAKDEKFFRELGARLAAARNALDVTQVELAEQLGVAQQTLAHYEGGRLRIPVSVLLEASRVLRFS
ncbi:MAG: helix-turn-helix domain-containing protein, partial [Vitreimonas sp.]